MKQKPMSPKFAATALLLAATGALLPASPAQAADLTTTNPPPITETVSKYNLTDFLNPTTPPSNWAVTYTPSVPVADQSEPAANSLLAFSADQALAQKTATEMQAVADQVAQQQAEESKLLKAAARDKEAADQAAADAKAAAQKAAAQKAAADKAAAEKAAADAKAAAAQAATVQAATSAPTTPATAPASPAATTAPSTSTSTATAAPASTTTAAPAATPAPVTGTTRQKIVQLANQYLGVPYVWGGSTPSGWDCSGFVQYVVTHATGSGFPRTATAQMHSGLLTQTSNPQPGDFVFFTEGGSAYHVGIYIGGGMMIHAPVPGQNTQVSAVWGTPTYMTLNG